MTNSDNKEITRRVQSIIEANNMSYAAFAKKLGVSPPNITNWLNEKRRISIDSCLIITKHFPEITLDYIYGINTDNIPKIYLDKLDRIKKLEKIEEINNHSKQQNTTFVNSFVLNEINDILKKYNIQKISYDLFNSINEYYTKNNNLTKEQLNEYVEKSLVDYYSD